MVKLTFLQIQIQISIEVNNQEVLEVTVVKMKKILGKNYKIAHL
jgi:hypothetical protein